MITLRAVVVLVLVWPGLLGLSPLAAAHETGTRGFRFTVTPATEGEQLVRTSLPLPQGFLDADHSIAVKAGRGGEVAGLRVLSWHPATNGEPRTARRALVTFPYRFIDRQPVTITLETLQPGPEIIKRLPAQLQTKEDSLELVWDQGPRVNLKLLAPPRTSKAPARVEVVEANRFYRWERLHYPDPQWPPLAQTRIADQGPALV